MTKKHDIPISLTKDEMAYIVKTLEREPNMVETGMIDIMFSEHCSYKSSRPILKQLPRDGPQVLVGPGQDAGVVALDEETAIAFKIESHNHPSAIEPYNGAATGIGGIIRDILCMGTRPIASIDSLHFGKLESAHTQWLFRYVVKGVADYGNCIGVPTVTGEVTFDKSFDTNCLVNVGCVGVGKRSEISPSIANTPGDILVLVGGSTGRDGIHGVTFASKTLTESSESDRSSVQIGDPFTKKKIIEATLEILGLKILRGLKDFGGGGLTCVTSEMAHEGGTGVRINLEKVPIREPDMVPYEIMLSESQERMLYVFHPKHFPVVSKILQKYDLPYAIIGEVTNTERVKVYLNDKLVADLPTHILADPPTIKRASTIPEYIKHRKSTPEPTFVPDIPTTLIQLLAHPIIASKRWVYRQYDHEVGVQTVGKPGAYDAAVLHILETPHNIAFKTDSNSLHVYADPYWGTAGVVAENIRNISAVGADPLALVNCCNFGNPEKPEIFWQFSEAIRGLADACRTFNVPVVGGNVSFYNEDDETKQAIKPNPVIMTLGRLPFEIPIPSMKLKSGQKLWLVGETYRELGGSLYYDHIHNTNAGNVPIVRYPFEIGAQTFIREIIRNKYVSTVHDVSQGGLGTALLEMIATSNASMAVNLTNANNEYLPPDQFLFSESHGRYVLGADDDFSQDLDKLAKQNKVRLTPIGDALNQPDVQITINKNSFEMSQKEIIEAYNRSIPSIMEAHPVEK